MTPSTVYVSWHASLGGADGSFGTFANPRLIARTVSKGEKDAVLG